MWTAWLACVDGAPAGDSGSLESQIIVTFNTGTTEGLSHDEGEDAYTAEHALISDEWYGDGLAWLPAIEATTVFFANLQPDVVAFQEVFDPSECADIPAEYHADFVCSEWTEGDPSVAEQVLGDGYTVQCFPGKSDKCLAVRDDLGSFGALTGEGVEGCGSGARVARGTIGGRTLVGVHGSSGFAGDDIDCRVAQVEQVFADLPDDVVILGDFNTDPGRQAETDASAAAWVESIVEPLHFISPVGEEAPRSYGGLADIDHVISDVLHGSCWHAGIDTEPVIDAVYFDHVPVVCEVQ
ncbi:MAG: hypothetical protein GY913_28795 [Proteobacteria bacterium]|nr:hypothetical protein [Pseudomonadota bacterium]MCP4920912.1 hypothetical protein [Pseudomonadota bacterium]